METRKSAKKTLTRIFLGFGLVLLLLIGGLVALLMFVEVDSLREPLARELSDATELRVELGPLHLDLSRGVGLKADGFRVRSQDGTRDLFSAEQLVVLTELEPLLHKQVKIQEATLVQPVVRIYLDSPKSREPPAAPPKESAVRQESGTPPPGPRLERKKSMDQGLEKARDVLKQTDFDLNHLRIESGRVLLVPPQDHPLLQGELPLEVSLDLWVSRPSREQLKLRVEDLDLALDGFRFQGRLEVDDLLSSTGRLTADLQSGSFPVSDLNRLRSSIPSLELPRALRRGQVKRIQIACSAPVMAMTDWESLRRTAKADLKLSIRDAAWNLEDSEIPLNTLKADFDWSHPSLHHALQADLGEGTLHVRGTADFASSENPKAPSQLRSEVRLDSVNLARLNLPRKEGYPLEGRLGGTIQITGALKVKNPLRHLRWSGHLEGQNLVLGPSETPTRLGEARLQIRNGSIDATTADIQVERVRVRGIPFRTARSRVRATPERLQLTDARIQPEHGTIELEGQYQFAPQAYAVRFQGDGLKAEEVTQQRLSGRARLSGTLEGRLLSKEIDPQTGSRKKLRPPARGLSGSVRLGLKDGAVRELGLLNKVLTLLNPSTALKAQTSGLPYDTLGGDFEIREGVVTTKNLELRGPQLALVSVGAADLSNRVLRAEIKAMPMQTLDKIVKSVPLLGKILTGGNQGGVIETYFEVRGTLEEPKVSLLTQKSLLEKPESILREITKIPGSLVGPDKETPTGP